MVIAINTGPWPPGLEGDEEAVTRLQEILLQVAEGARGSELDSEYKELRKAFLENAEFSDVAPGSSASIGI